MCAEKLYDLTCSVDWNRDRRRAAWNAAFGSHWATTAHLFTGQHVQCKDATPSLKTYGRLFLKFSRLLCHRPCFCVSFELSTSACHYLQLFIFVWGHIYGTTPFPPPLRVSDGKAARGAWESGLAILLLLLSWRKNTTQNIYLISGGGGIVSSGLGGRGVDGVVAASVIGLLLMRCVRSTPRWNVEGCQSDASFLLVEIGDGAGCYDNEANLGHPRRTCVLPARQVLFGRRGEAPSVGPKPEAAVANSLEMPHGWSTLGAELNELIVIVLTRVSVGTTASRTTHFVLQ